MKVTAYLLEDLPIPDDADIIKYPKVLLEIFKQMGIEDAMIRIDKSW